VILSMFTNHSPFAHSRCWLLPKQMAGDGSSPAFQAMKWYRYCDLCPNI
jgi:hypothetical protein